MSEHLRLLRHKISTVNADGRRDIEVAKREGVLGLVLGLLALTHSRMWMGMLAAGLCVDAFDRYVRGNNKIEQADIDGHMYFPDMG